MNVKVYSTPTCHFCLQLKEWLNKHKIEFENVDVSTDQKASQEMMEKSGQMGVPVTDIDGEIIIGFDKGRIAGKLNVTE